MAKADDAEWIEVAGRTVRVSSPAKPYFSKGVQLTKLDIVHYFLSVAPAALRGIQDRPIVLKRFVNGACLASGQPEPFYQKRAPTDLPAWMRTVTLSFPSGRTADEVVVDNPAGLAWIANLGCIELHPHPVRTADLDHPDELRIDLDPQPGIPWADVRSVAMEVKALLDELGLTGWPKTSGSRGIHINVRIHPRWTFTEVRRAALALARAVERRSPLASSKWWKEERHGVFLDYNQNAKDRTTAAAYSVRPLPDARVSTPLHWDEVLTCDPADFTVLTVPDRLAKLGDPHEAMDQHADSLEPLLDLAARDEAEGLGDAPWPPHFAKQEGESKRVAPTRAKKLSDQLEEGFGPKRFRKQAKKKEALAPTADDHNPAGRPERSRMDFSRDIARPTSPAASAAEGGSSSGLQPAEATHSIEGASAPGLHAQAADSNPSAETASTPPRKRRQSKMPLITIAQSPDRAAADAGLERWKAAHPEAAALLTPDDILIDRMRGASSIWYRIRINLRHVPEPHRPPQQTPDPDQDPTRPWRED